MPLGIIPHNDNTTDGMVEILKHVRAGAEDEQGWIQGGGNTGHIPPHHAHQEATSTVNSYHVACTATYLISLLNYINLTTLTFVNSGLTSTCYHLVLRKFSAGSCLTSVN